MDITRVKKEENKSTYLLHNPNPEYTQQYELWGKQGAVGYRISRIRDSTIRRDMVANCQAKAKFRKEEAKARAIKAITLFLMTNPEKVVGKTRLIKALKAFSDSKGIKVSEEKFRSLYHLYGGLAR